MTDRPHSHQSGRVWITVLIGIATIALVAGRQAWQYAQSIPAAPQQAAPQERTTLPDGVFTELLKLRHQIGAIPSQFADRPANNGVRFFAANPGQQLTVRFLDDRIRLNSGLAGRNWEWELQLGSDDPKTLSAEGNRLSYTNPSGAQEWFRNTPSGIEHGMHLPQRPADAPPGSPLRLTIHVNGLTPTEDPTDPENNSILLCDASDKPILRYADLRVWDALQSPLAAHMETDGKTIMLVITDRTAVYPVMIDPVITSLEAELQPGVSGSGSQGDQCGFSVALDGETAVIGAPFDDTLSGNDAGRAFVFFKGVAGWESQGALEAVPGRLGAQFGYSVDVAGDAAIVGAYADQSFTGTAHVFRRSEGTWAHEAQLSPSTLTAGDRAGTAVAISGDTALVGSPRDGAPVATNRGSAAVFLRSANVWSQQAILVASDGAVSDFFGQSLALDGNTAAVGSLGDDTATGSNAGSVYVFDRSGSTWSQTTRLDAGSATAGENFGQAVSLSGDTLAASTSRATTAAGSLAGRVSIYLRTTGSWALQQTIEAGDAAASDQFGYSLAVDGDSLIVGAPYRDEGAATDAGAAYTFTRSTGVWTQAQKLTAPAPQGLARFGWAVALSADLSLVGSPAEDTIAGIDAGTSYVYERNTGTWSLQTNLSNGEAGAGDRFGWSVALDGNTVVAGSRSDDTVAGADTGSVYVFTTDGSAWTLQTTILPGDAGVGDLFGSSVSLVGDSLAVGAPSHDATSIADSGAAYVWVRSASVWSQQAKLIAPTPQLGAELGTQISMNGDTVIAGAPLHDLPSKVDAGSAFVFFRNGVSWSSQQQLTASDSAASDLFGSAVGISGNTAVVGAPQNDTGAGADAGSAYIYNRSGSTWTQVTPPLLPTDPVAGAFFGAAVAIDSGSIVVGAPWDDRPSGLASGSAYVFAGSGTSWPQEGKLQALCPTQGEYFGAAAAISGDRVLIGSPGAAVGGLTSAGTVTLFERTAGNWSLQTQATASPTQTSAQVGSSVALQGTLGIAGAADYDASTLEGGVSTDRGSVFVFEFATAASPGTISVHFGATTEGPEIISEQPEPVHLGYTAPGVATSRMITIANTGGGDLFIGCSQTANPFSLTNAPAGVVIAPGASYTFSVRGLATSFGTKTGNLLLVSNASNVPTFTLPMDFTVLPAAYNAWATAGGLTGDDASPLASIPAGGITNLERFAFNIPAQSAMIPPLEADIGAAGLPLIMVVPGTPNRLRFQFVRRIDAIVSYSAMRATTLNDWQEILDEPIIESIDDHWERVTYEEDLAVDASQIFFKVSLSFGL